MRSTHGDFAPGQRWVSNTESELGLGIVVEFADRRVVMSFPAANERRVYAIDNAPLSRVVYNVGETITSDDGRTMKISECREVNGCVIYIGTDLHGVDSLIAEIDLDSFVQFSRPLDRLFAGQIDSTTSFVLRCESRIQQHRHAQSAGYGLLGPRVQLLPHQFFIAREVSDRYRPRVLLADEVGLGKTIEAGLIVHQQLFAMRAQRVLIVVPDSLIHQWLVEMIRRFNLHFTILDEETCQAIEGEDDDDIDADAAGHNPFESAQLVLIGLSLIADCPERAAQAQAAEWDILVVDEAHHLHWEPRAASPAYLAVDALARASAGVLLLTATPEQLGVTGHFARLRLLDPDRYFDFDAFQTEQQNYQPIAELVTRLKSPSTQHDISGDAEMQTHIAELLGNVVVDEIQRADGAERRALCDRASRELLDRYGTGRVLFRNCRDTVQGFPARRLHSYPLEAPPQYLSRQANYAPQARLMPETILGSDWLTIDPRVHWLATFLTENRPHKTLVICAQAATAVALEEHLRMRHGLRTAVFHEGLDLVQRDRAAAYFADQQDSAEALVCSEIGSEGRNFQFAHHLVLFDLPLTPDLLEQRIGRLDRIGQDNIVELHLPYYEGSATEVLRAWYHEGLDAFESVFSAGWNIFRDCEDQLLQGLNAPADEQLRADLIADTVAKTRLMRAALRAGRDRLTEFNSFDADRAASILESVTGATRKLELANYMDGVFDFFGVEQQVHGPQSVVVHPTEQMRCHSFPGLPEGGLTATYDRTTALTHEDMQFLTWEHPMVTGAMDMLLSGEFGNACLCALKAPFLKPGSLLLEAIYEMSCPAPGSMQLMQYLPHGTIRIVVDRSGKDLSAVLTSERVNTVVEPLKKHVATEIAKHARAEIIAMADRAAHLAETQLPDLITAAIESMERLQHSELSRLQALAKVNPNIRAEEIAYHRAVADEMRSYLSSTQLRLDAVRVGLAT